MARWKVWLLPAALATAQVMIWPGLAITQDKTLHPVRTTALLLLILLITAALGLRRRHPVAVLALLCPALTAGGWIAPEQVFLVPGDSLLVTSVADLIALFSVAVLCSRRTTALAVTAMTGWLTATTALAGGDLSTAVLGAVTYVLVAAAGRIRRRWVADRAAAARRLAEAEQADREAAQAERRRLARELHDVTAHHLTSVVVQASTAQFLAGRHPGLRDEALTFAARTGHEALADLRRLVAVLPHAEGTPERIRALADLADDFRQLGQVVVLDEPAGPLPPALAEAVHGIARESLTNTLRYAPGATVRVRLSSGPTATELVIDDDGPGGRPATGQAESAGHSEPAAGRGGRAAAPSGRGGAATHGLGGGRGLTGMAERATALGGTLRAGPRAEGGWRVHALLPAAAAAPRRAALLRSSAVLDGALVLLTVLFPLTGVVTFAEEAGAGRTAVLLVLLAVLAHAAPLLWRRRHPWTVLAAVAVTTWLGPLLVASGTMRAEESWTFLFSVGADLAAVYAVAARGARPGLTWIAPLAALASTSAALGVLLAAGTPADSTEPVPGPVMFLLLTATMTVFVALALALPVAAAWLAGQATRRRRQRLTDREEGAVLTATARAELRARDERSRVAAGLHSAVLHHAAQVPRAAEAADLPGVVEAGRQALAAMRSLVDSLNTAPAGPAAPEPHPGVPAAPASSRTPAPHLAAPAAGPVRQEPVGPVREPEVPTSESA